MTELDRRLNAYRPDLADASLKGLVEAARFASGEAGRVTVPVIALRPQPEVERGIDTEILYGEEITIFERRNGWCWGKALSDGYVGYLPEEAVSLAKPAPTHIVTVPRTFVYPEPELRKPHVATLSMGSRVTVAEHAEARGNHYIVLSNGKALFSRHVRPLTEPPEEDYVAVAARFLETPYLWGGRSGFGIDCSGLVQLAMLMAGQSAPRDTDMQASGLGMPIDRSDLTHGDLVFWKGHVAIMEDAETMIHANGNTMTVARERLDDAIARIGHLYGQPTQYRRP
ncbi:C40 family peptidase [Oryzifoliimicrobium ureilyticus]|uniref:C40 family peptidase n=1 Tax=Oryzifoliimicrobium ureilyticus TaxID=3113724 RepID=UPI0030766BDD